MSHPGEIDIQPPCNAASTVGGDDVRKSDGDDSNTQGITKYYFNSVHEGMLDNLLLLKQILKKVKTCIHI